MFTRNDPQPAAEASFEGFPEALLATDLDALFWKPTRVGVMSAWWGHVPFAHWIATVVRPSILVELGTHNGVSFSAFCEGMLRQNVIGRCFAVDTWKGDEHAGLYSEEVFESISLFNRTHYGAFAELLRTTFDEAAPYFADGSIDLLHIDGLHTYEAVKKDFDTWLPKLSRRAVVIFHDTNVRERDFGVWKLWAELRARYPSFEFLHGHGLGILAVGPDQPDAIKALCSLDEARTAVLRDRLAHLGARWINMDLAERSKEHLRLIIDQMGQAAAAHQQQQAHLQAEISQQMAQIGQFQQNATSLEARSGELQEYANTLEKHTGQLEQRVRSLEAAIEGSARTVSELQTHLAAQQSSQDMRDTHISLHAKRIVSLEGELRQQLRDNLAGQKELSRHLAQLADLATDLERRRAGLVPQAARTPRPEESPGLGEMLRSEALVSSLSQQVAQLNERLAAKHAELEAVYASNSWRVTGLLRYLRSGRHGALRRPEAQDAAAPDQPAMVSAAQPSLQSMGAQPEAAGPEEAIGQAVSQDPPSQMEMDIDAIRGSEFFDREYYGGTADAQAAGMDPAEHYVRFGEAQGIAPSQWFDPAYYRRRNPDITEEAGSALAHYIRFGKAEGRAARSMIHKLEFPKDRLDPGRETVVVAIHDASRTGAPILGWNIVGELRKQYNVVVLLKRGGVLQQALSDASSGLVVLPDDFILHDAELAMLAEAIVKHYAPLYLIANSVETRYFVPGFEKLNVPAVALIHEFSSAFRPLGVFHELFQTASQIVFPAQIVADAALKEYRNLHPRRYHVLAQGPSSIPPDNDDHEASAAAESPAAVLPPADGSLLVVGAGTVTMRKGVEFFIAAAAEVRRQCGDMKIRFAWVGSHFSFDQPYMDFLVEQVERSGLDDGFEFLGEFSDLDPVYDRADIFFLPSRLDPLPNVSIDCALRGIPIVCFDQASGTAEILNQSEDTRGLVVPYLDSGAAASVILDLARDPARRAAVSEAVRNMAQARFNLPNYVRDIDALARAAIASVAQVARDHAVIMEAGAYNAEFNLGPSAGSVTPDEGLTQYLHASRKIMPRGRPGTGTFVRRPMEGFNPLVYAAENPQYDEASGEDPLAHYIRTNYPPGRWCHPILQPRVDAPPAATNLKVAVHGHFHYPELLPDFIERLRRNTTDVDLLLTTSGRAQADEIGRIVARLDVRRVTTTVVPNRGRDIGPMFSGLPKGLLASYDVVGHFHGKRSPHVHRSVGETWRNFLWEHLVGGEFTMMDHVMEAFAENPALGLVFAEDPHLNDWDRNREFADDLAARMGMALPLPNHFDFPQGTMFWARPAVLKPIADLGFTWDDYPPEPLPIDGTMLHTLERLLPFCAKHTGFGYATTYLRAHRR